MLASVRSAVLLGVQGLPLRVEVHVSTGLPGYSMVGLPDAAGRESRERVRAALLSSGLEWPTRRVTVNLAPAGLRKTGAGYELAIALGLLEASAAIPAGALDGVAVLGELGLDGSVRPVTGTLALVDALAAAGAERVIVPEANAVEAGLVGGIEVCCARTLGEIVACLKDGEAWPDPPPAPPCEHDDADGVEEPLDLADVRGLGEARRALAACAAGGHHLLLVGPPGAGKTMLARRLPSILPPLEPDEALEVSRIHSAAGASLRRLARTRPFRAPHHTASAPALVGGGSPRPRPGEVSRAHRGALFLDELAEFAPSVLDALRQPLEERVVRISRQAMTLTFPADFVLVGCCNPCPCGRGDAACGCNEVQRQRYRRRISAPLLDRFDLRLHVRPPAAATPPGPTSSETAATVAAAVARQRQRYRDRRWKRNAHVPPGALALDIPLGPAAQATWRELSEERMLSARGAARVWRVARTLADLDDRSEVTSADVELAATLRDEVIT